jgi:NAD(P)H-dependent FMN reductase
MIHRPRLLVIAGSVRPQRICVQVAEWVAAIGREAMAAELELADLRDWPLPMDDEPEIPAAGAGYANEHTRAWSRKIAAAAGFVFVTPQYNWGYPAPLKNALDHLYAEWGGKPAMIVTYGGHGGDRCSRQLREVLTALKMTPVETAPALMLPRAHIEGNSGAIDPAETFAEHAPTIRRGFAELSAALSRVAADRP